MCDESMELLMKIVDTYQYLRLSRFIVQPQFAGVKIFCLSTGRVCKDGDLIFYPVQANVTTTN